MKRICVWGTSLKKVGDEAQIIAFVRIIKSRYPDAEITLYSQFGERMTRLVAKENIKVRTIRTARLGKVARALRRTDIFVFEGGPFYEEPRQVLCCLTLLSIARIFRVPVVVYAATAFRFQTWWGRFIFRSIFDQMDEITVREPLALAIIKDLGIKKKVGLFADPRFTLKPPPPETVDKILTAEGINPREPYIVITTRYLHPRVPAWVKRSHQYRDEIVEKANEAIAKVVAYLETLGQLVVLPMHPHYGEDMEMVKAIRALMKDPSRLKLLSRRYAALEMIGIIHQCEMLIASRLGSAVFCDCDRYPYRCCRV